MGLLAGTALLVANKPRSGGRPSQLAYRELVKVSFVPLVVAALVATAAGVVNASAQLGSSRAAALDVAPDRVRSFVIASAVHAGSYAGALLGTVGGTIMVLA
jgi:hypothetical protein